jgi:hypothetical protein
VCAVVEDRARGRWGVSNRAARFTEAEIRRLMRAAKAEGFDRVEVIDSPEGLKLVCERRGFADRRPADTGEHMDI